ncbi:MAG TPA: sugar phosphate isomerase/epimerase [Terriglobia bacterium]|nr:sugar phosphate isomerase/epimerase [Terriglobia bacterium]
MKSSLPRREFLVRSGQAGLAWMAASLPASAAAASLPNPVGYATISWPRNQFEQALDTISSLHYQGAQLLGWVADEYAGSKQAELHEKLQSLHITPVALSCWGVTLDPAILGPVSNKFAAYAQFFHGLNGHYLQVTDGGHPHQTYSPDQIKALGARMNELGKIAGDSGLQVGYHPHFGTLGETRQGLGKVLEATDPSYVKLIADVAHLSLGGADPAEVIRTYRDRLLFLHFKDVRKDIAKLAAQNRDQVRTAKYHFCEIGTGAVDFAAILAAMRETRFSGWVIVELDAYEPPPGGPAEAARTNAMALEKMGFKIRSA